jgi:DNA-directed RNA polymerase specialized sigma24 family protein
VKGIPELAIEVQPPPTVTTASAIGMGTAELLDVAVEAGYDGPAWTELERRLVVRAFPNLERAIASGTIYHRCARAGVRIQRRADLQIHPYPEDIAAEAVEDCLRRFQNTVLPGGQWDPGQGTSLEDFFCVCCLPDVANRWRWHLRRLPEATVSLRTDGEDQILALPVEPVGDPADTVEHRDLVAQALTPMNPADQTAFVLMSAGWTPEEIARTLGITRNTFDARTSRARKGARARRTW